MRNDFNLFVRIFILPIFLLLFFVFSSASCKKEASKSNQKVILSFILKDQVDSAQIDKVGKTIQISVNFGSDLKHLSPSIKISNKATIKPVSGDSVDFSLGPVIYTVTAEDKSTQQWTVTVIKVASKIPKNIITFNFGSHYQFSQEVIDTLAHTVLIELNPSFSLSVSLIPTIVTSPGTTINPASGTPVYFGSKHKNYTVTASDGSTQIWNVIVSIHVPMTIHVTNFSIPGQISVTSDDVSKKIIVIMPIGTNYTSLFPTFTLSEGVTSVPASEQNVDFSKGYVDYSTTATDGTKAIWRVITTAPLIYANNSNIEYSGRISFTNPSQPTFSAPGVYFQSKFTGTYCDIDLSDPSGHNYIEVVIDGGAPVRMSISSTTMRVASNLPNTDHTILICKDTEGSIGKITFNGFRCDGLVSPPTLPSRKIECFGNSITCGAKMMTGTWCDQTAGSNWNISNRAYLSYGAVTARDLNAQWHLTSISGIGLVQSCCGMTYTMPNAYDQLYLDNSASKWDFTQYIPDVVTICLGQNDGSGVDTAAFRTKYVSFIGALRTHYPIANTSIFLLTSPMADLNLYNFMDVQIDKVLNQMVASGDNKIYKVVLPYGLNSGCQSHPDSAQHQQIAATLEIAIKSKLGW